MPEQLERRRSQLRMGERIRKRIDSDTDLEPFEGAQCREPNERGLYADRCSPERAPPPQTRPPTTPRASAAAARTFASRSSRVWTSTSRADAIPDRSERIDGELAHVHVRLAVAVDERRRRPRAHRDEGLEGGVSTTGILAVGECFEQTGKDEGLVAAGDEAFDRRLADAPRRIPEPQR